MKNLIIFSFLIIFIPFKSFSNQISTLASIDQSIVTNYDLFMEIKLFEIIEKKKINKDRNVLILNQLIDQKVKELELKKYNIKIDENQINNKIKLLVNVDIDKELKSLLKKKIITDSQWNKLIYLKFKDKLELNIKEIEEKTKNFEKVNIEEVIRNEKNKKINIISKTYFNEIKKKYYIKKF